MEEDLDLEYRRTLDSTVGHYVDIFDSRPYDLVGRRVSFADYDEPVDFLLVNFDQFDVKAGYVYSGDAPSIKREMAADRFLRQFNGGLWTMMAMEISDDYNTNLDEQVVEGEIYYDNRENEVDEFLQEFAGSGLDDHPRIVLSGRELF